MIDAKIIRDNPEIIAKKLSLRGVDFDVNQYQLLETQRKTLQQEVENLQAKRNATAKQIGIAKQNNQDVDVLKASVNEFAQELDHKKTQLNDLLSSLDKILFSLPNILDDKVPEGEDESDNIVHSHWGQPKPFGFTFKDHVQIAESKGWLDFNKASQLTSTRFSILKGDLALLHRALAQFMINYHCNHHGYMEANVPFIVNNQTLFGTGQLPKFEQDLFSVANGDKEVNHDRQLYLIPTAEVPLTNFVADEILQESDLPLRLVAHTPCFRSEAGNSGKDIKGLMRQHQFEKVELVQICKPENSWDVLEEMTTHAETILKELELPFQRIILCSKDVGFASSFTYDLEVWLPSQKTYREISSISNCLDFQARRMKARWKDQNNNNQLVHTLNGSGVAVGRALLAILENHQLENGDIAIPQALHPYMNGKTVI